MTCPGLRARPSEKTPKITFLPPRKAPLVGNLHSKTNWSQTRTYTSYDATQYFNVRRLRGLKATKKSILEHLPVFRAPCEADGRSAPVHGGVTFRGRKKNDMESGHTHRHFDS